VKLKKVASLCGKTKMFCLYDRAERDDVVSQWLGDGYAIYPITGLPYMDEENIYSMFDISAKQQEKIIFRHGPAPEGINLDDVDPTERRLSDDGLSVAFLISPFGLPKAAIWLLGKVQDLKYSIQDKVYE